jgi:hypothetical protein
MIEYDDGMINKQMDDELAKLAERLGDAMQEKADLVAENKRLTTAMARGGGTNDELLRRVSCAMLRLVSCIHYSLIIS